MPERGEVRTGGKEGSMTEQERAAGAVGRLAAKALLYEVCAAPKPGLVDRFNSGAHRDMDIFTFVDSALALEPYFARCALAGHEAGRADGALLAVLRPLGLAAEETMLRATGGVNTHKGAIFSLGLLCAAVGCCGCGDAETLCRAAGDIAAPVLDDYRRADFAARTAGERFYASAGVLGVRGEAAAGFPSVRRIALPQLERALADGRSINDACVLALLALIASVDATTMRKRGGARVDALHDEARALLADWSAERTAALDARWSRLGVSAGGCADLLGAALLLHFLPGAGICFDG